MSFKLGSWKRHYPRPWFSFSQWHGDYVHQWFLNTPWRRYWFEYINERRRSAKLEIANALELKKAYDLIWKQIHQRTKELGLKNLATWNKEGKLLPGILLEHEGMPEGYNNKFWEITDASEPEWIDVEQFLKENNDQEEI